MTSDDGPLPAGGLSAWITEVQSAIRGERAADVACGSCTACCTSSQFVHIGPDETDALAHIPRELLFPAPRMPKGHVLLGYDERGHCPMLVDGACSIYEHRPRTCRTYDCRIFPATGIDLDDDDKALIAERARRWRFEVQSDEDHRRHGALRAAAAFLDAHPSSLPPEAAPATTTQRAVMAVEIHDLFLRGADQIADLPTPDVDAIGVELLKRRARQRP
ncbi:MAG TPA: YkgJ family cysteine cluster protein [Acidimicrobiales bacterium]|nr:YkgJ family cysteine cluster protein [Acidimicrobiales bacterium]